MRQTSAGAAAARNAELQALRNEMEDRLEAEKSRLKSVMEERYELMRAHLQQQQREGTAAAATAAASAACAWLNAQFAQSVAAFAD
jgi:hypothetical protein